VACDAARGVGRARANVMEPVGTHPKETDVRARQRVNIMRVARSASKRRRDFHARMTKTSSAPRS